MHGLAPLAGLATRCSVQVQVRVQEKDGRSAWRAACVSVSLCVVASACWAAGDRNATGSVGVLGPGVAWRRRVNVERPGARSHRRRARAHASARVLVRSSVGVHGRDGRVLETDRTDGNNTLQCHGATVMSSPPFSTLHAALHCTTGESVLQNPNADWQVQKFVASRHCIRLRICYLSFHKKIVSCDLWICDLVIYDCLKVEEDWR